MDAAYTKGDLIKINASGFFEKTTVRSEAVGFALETLTTTDDLLKIRLLE